MKKIHWRPLAECPLYWVSSDGRVKTFRLRRGILKPGIEKGYQRVRIIDRSIRVHRLVAFAFLRPKPGCGEVNHIDANKSNNNYTNLEFTTHMGNMQHCDRLGLRQFRSGADHGRSKLTAKDVTTIRSLYALGQTSYPKLSRQFGISISSAQRIVTKQTWKYHE